MKCSLRGVPAISLSDQPVRESLAQRVPKQLPHTWIAGFALAAILSHFALRLFAQHWLAEVPLYAAVFLGGAPLIWGLAWRLAHFQFGSDLLAGLSIVTSALTGQYLAGAIIVLMLAGGAALEVYATGRAKSVLAALRKRTPTIAHQRIQTGLVDIPLDQVSVGDKLVILPNEIAPVDGTVVEGHGRMDESYLTGEPFQISKTPGSAVLSGAVNGEAALVIIATKRPADSRHAQIVELLNAAETHRPQLRRLGDSLGAWYTPLAVAIAAGTWIWSGDPLRFLAVIVIATPCPLLIAIPVSILGAISLAAKRGIIVKNPAALEQMDECDTVIFDKTGTLTYGKPVLTEILCESGVARDEVLRKAACLEQYSKHPLATSILTAARVARLALVEATFISEKPGAGLRGMVEGVVVRITGRSKVPDVVLPAATTGLECVVFLDEKVAAVFRFRDEPRADSKPFISHLRPRHGVKRVVLLSGDREEEVRHLGRRLGITEVYFGKSPEDKVAIIAEIHGSAASGAKTLFVGDGINDAPAMLRATVGVALGSNSDITSEAADAVILESSLEKTDELIHIGRRMRKIALQSAVGGMILSGIGMVMAAAGWLPPLTGAVVQEVIDLAAVLNALRVSFHPGRLADF